MSNKVKKLVVFIDSHTTDIYFFKIFEYDSKEYNFYSFLEKYYQENKEFFWDGMDAWLIKEAEEMCHDYESWDEWSMESEIGLRVIDSKDLDEIEVIK